MLYAAPVHPLTTTALEATSADPVAWLVNYGVAGVVIALLVTGFLRTKAEVQGLQKQVAEIRDDLIAERAANAALVAQITQHTLPQMTHVADVLDRTQQAQSTTVPVSDPALVEQMRVMAGIRARLDERTGGA